MAGSLHKRLWLAALLVLFAAACGSDGTESSDEGSGGSGGSGEAASDDEVCTEDRVGGELTMGMYSETRGLDPMVVAGSGVAGGIESAAVFDRLAQWNPETGEFEPRLAESIEPNEDFTQWTVTLRPDVTFGNGDPLTAEAVRFSVERMQSEDNLTSQRGQALTIQSVEVVDDMTVRFDVGDPWPGFPAVLADEVGMIVNPAVVEELGPEEFATMPVGAGVGPYEPERFVPGEEIVLTAKDDYWGGPVCIETLRFVAIPGANDTYDAFANGDLDMAFIRQPSVVAQAREDGVNEFVTLQNLGEVLLLNQGIGGNEDVITTDERIRRAIDLAIDYEQVTERAEDGAGIPTNAVIGEGSLYYEGVEGNPHDPEEAEALVEEVKEETGWDGSLHLSCDGSREDALLAIAAQLDAVGFDVETDLGANLADHITRVRQEQDYEVACWGFSVDDANTWMRLNQNVGSSGTNATGYASDAMDAALADLRAAENDDQRKTALEAVQEVWNEEIPSVGLSAIEELIIWGDHVRGLDFTSKTVVFFDQAWIDE
jgi:peptide/nickel transport system substrate-binding protein